MVNMSKLLDEILRTEEEAKQILKNAEKKCDEITKQTKIEEDEIKQKHKKNTSEKLIEIEEQKAKNCREKLKEIEEKKEAEIERLKDVFSKNNKIWVEEIVFNVIKQ